MTYRRGDVFYKDFDTNNFNKRLLQGRRPYVILQDTTRKQVHVKVAPLSTGLQHTNKEYTCKVVYGELSLIHLEQILPMDVTDIPELHGRLNRRDIEKLSKYILKINSLDGAILGYIIKANWKGSDKEFRVIEGKFKIMDKIYDFSIPEKIYQETFIKTIPKKKLYTNLRSLQGLSLMINYITRYEPI